MVDRRLSADPCLHECCASPEEPDHMHLFDPDDCPSCRLAQSRFVHPSNRRES